MTENQYYFYSPSYPPSNQVRILPQSIPFSSYSPEIPSPIPSAHTTLKLQNLESEILFKDEEITRLNSHITELKTYITESDSKLEKYFFSASNPISENGKVISELQEFLKKREKMFENERNQLLTILQTKENLCKALHDSKIKENQLFIDELEIKLTEKERICDSLIEENSELKEKNSDLEININENIQLNMENFKKQREELETKIEKVLSENDQILKINNNLLVEIENLRILYSNADKNYYHHIEELKSNQKSQLESLKDDLIYGFELEKNSFSNQLHDLQDYSKTLKQNYDDLSLENQRLRIENNELINEKHQKAQKKEDLVYYIARVNELEEKIQILILKNNELTNLNEISESELIDLKSKYEGMKNSHFDVLSQLQLEFEEKKNDIIEKAINYETEILVKENNDLKNKIESMENGLTDFKERIEGLLSENWKLNQALEERLNENENLRINKNELIDFKEKNIELADKIGILNSKNNELNCNIEELLNENHKINQIIEARNQELEDFKNKFICLRDEFINKNKDMNEEIIELRTKQSELMQNNQLLNFKLAENDENNLKLTHLLEETNLIRKTLEKENLNYQNSESNLNNQIDYLNEEKINIISNFEEKNQENFLLKEKIHNLEQNFNLQNNELLQNFSKTEQICEQLKRNLEEKDLILSQKNSIINELQQENLEQNKNLTINKQIMHELHEELRQISESRELLIKSIEKERKEFYEQNQNFLEIQDQKNLLETIHEEKVKKHQEIEVKYQGFYKESQVKIGQLNEEIEKYKNLAFNIAKLEELVENLKNDNSNLNNNLINYERKNEDMECYIREIEEKEKVLQHNYKVLIEENRNNILKINDLIRRNNELTQKIENLNSEHEICFEKLNSEKNIIEEKAKNFIKIKENEFKNKIEYMENQINLIINDKDNNNRENDKKINGIKLEFEEKINEVEIYYRNHINSLKDTILEYERQINRFKGENEILFNEKERFIREISDLQGKIDIIERNKIININNNKENFREFRDIDIRNVNYGKSSDFGRFQNNIRIENRPVVMDRSLGILKDNERLNEQILRRCRQIVGEK